MNNEQPKDEYEGISPEALAMMEDFLANQPQAPASKESLRDCAEEVVEYETACATFESHHNLEALHAITTLSAKDASQHPLRAPAKDALGHITVMLNILKKETNISEEELARLQAIYKRLSQAVGNINDGIVYHDRE